MVNNNEFHEEIKNKMSNTIVNQNKKIDLIEKNREIKHRSKVNIENELNVLRK